MRRKGREVFSLNRENLNNEEYQTKKRFFGDEESSAKLIRGGEER